MLTPTLSLWDILGASEAIFTQFCTLSVPKPTVFMLLITAKTVFRTFFYEVNEEKSRRQTKAKHFS